MNGGMSRTATIRQCAILAGGLGTRLGAIAATTPKPVLPVGGRPFLGWLMREVSRFGVEEVVILAGHLSERVREAVAEIAATLPRRLSVVFSEEPVRAGTGGALFHARHLLDERFLLLNGDSLLDFNLAAMLAAARTDPEEVLGRIAVRRVPDASRYGAVALDGDRVTAFAARPPEGSPAAPGTINGGVYLLDRRLIDRATAVCSLEQDIFPALAAEGRLRASPAEGYFIDIGIPADFDRAQTELPRALNRPALLLDRDGTINIDHGWVGTRDRWEWMPGAREAVALATAKGWHVFVVTNQSGIARGLYDEAQLAELHAWMAEALRAAGGTVDDTRYCPYHPEAKLDAWRRVSDWRKPAPGMLLDLMRAWNLDPARCVMIGDQPTDMQAATAAGMTGHLFPGGNLFDFLAPLLGG
jgi:D,D-heptose 1,7-bisphosphate phosphatase